jgi:hypothetical protein
MASRSSRIGLVGDVVLTAELTRLLKAAARRGCRYLMKGSESPTDTPSGVALTTRRYPAESLPRRPTAKSGKR